MIVVFALGFVFLINAIIQRKSEREPDVEHVPVVEPPAATAKPD